MPPRTPVGTGGGGGGGASTRRYNEVQTFDVSVGATGVLFASGIASDESGSVLPSSDVGGLHNLRYTFPVGWDGEAVTAHFLDRSGAAATEVVTTPGAGGGDVEGSKVVAKLVSLTCAGTGDGSKVVDVSIGRRFCAANAPITAWRRIYTFAVSFDVPEEDVDLTNGTAIAEQPGSSTPVDPDPGSYNILYEA